MSGFVKPPQDEQERWAKKQEEFREKCKEEDIVNPPQNPAHKVARTLWRILTFPRDPRTY